MTIDNASDMGWTDAVAETLRIWASPERAEKWGDLLEHACVPIALWGTVSYLDGHEYLDGFYVEPATCEATPNTWLGQDPADAIARLTMFIGAHRARGDESLSPQPPEADPDARLSGIGLLLREKHEATGVESTSIYLADEWPEMYVARFCGTDHIIVDHAPAPDTDADLIPLVTDIRSVYRPVHFALYDMLVTSLCDPEDCAEGYTGPEIDAILAAVTETRAAGGGHHVVVSANLDPDNRLN